jgi:sulfoxide reductase catalytic subunit YedY
MGMPFSHLEERVYDFRCVEAWSMVIPYNGRPLRDIIKVVEPMGSARYVAFTSVYRPDELPGQASAFSTLEWPYVEALTLEEAVHPLTFATFGVYGDRHLPQNGLPFRITVPWKYGFKSPKFIVRITFTKDRPNATWHRENPSEYGWYSNVYPSISHPRWSQATERRIWGDGDIERIPSRPFNGYAEQVAHLYPGSKQQYR